MSAMVESGRAHTPAGGSMHAEKEYTTNENSQVSNLHSVSDLLKERLVHREDDGAEKNSPSHEGEEERVGSTDYISHSGSETTRENGVHELTSMVSRHVSMMGGYSNDDNSDSANVLRGMLRGKNNADINSGTKTDSTGSGSMIGKLLQRDQNNESSSTARGANSSYDIDVDGDSSMPSITTPNDFSDDDMSDRSPSAFMEEDEEFNEELNLSGSSSKSNKRARVENIINSMNRSSSPVKETPVTPIDQRRHKRKQYIPQQHDSGRSAPDSDPEPEAKMRRLEEDALQKQIKMMQEQLVSMQQRYTDMYQQHQTSMDGDIDLAEVERRCHQRQLIINGMQEKESKIQELSKRHGLLGPVEIDSSPFLREARKMVDGKFGACKTQISPLTGDTPKDLESLAVMLKNEIRHSVGTLVDNVVARFVEETKRVQKDQHSPPQSASVPAAEPEATELPSPAKEKPSPPEPAKTPTQAPTPRQPTPPPQPQQQQQQPQQQQTPILSHSIHKITNNNNNNNEIKPITIAPKQNVESAFSPEKQSPLPRIEQPKPTRTKVTDKIIHPFFDHPKPSFADLLRHAPLFPPPPYFHQFPHPMPPMFHHHHHPQPKISNEPEPEQTEALALVVNTPKKKRTKVTDTRLSPRAARALLQEPVPTASHDQSGEPPSNHFNNGDFTHHPHHPVPHSEPGMLPIHPNLLPTSLPTSVAIPNPSLQHSDILSNMYGSHQDHPATFPDFSVRVSTSRSPSVRDHGSPSMHPHDYGMFGRGGGGDSSNGDMFDGESCTNMDGYPMTTTLTPMHLRKAKLMFFFTRYPSSSILKVYFPDIKFNKNNTAQLVKWFSNFREFYYIQMEKYSRQALAEGVKNPEDLIVTTDSEIYRVLNLHYNRNNQLEVPESFRVVVQASLREFFKSIQAGKDSEQSWKKAIYKVIARMDDALPEYFKSPNWMEQLNDN